jgi:NitT/TauT family transport system ATP-binding protein
MPVTFENTALPDIIELKNVCQEYEDPKTGKPNIIIKDLNLLIEDIPGEPQVIGLLGESGCGKSTVLRFIAGLQQPTSGSILFYGEPRNKSDKVCMIFQRYSSFPWLTVLENVSYGLMLGGIDKKKREDKAVEMIRTVGLGGQEHKYPAELSGGQQQRVAIARSLAIDPKVLCLDEPFSALDLNNRLKMQELLISIWTRIINDNKDITLLLVTHSIEEAVLLCQKIFIMAPSPGRITEQVAINLPKERSKALKRSPQFLELVDYIERKMVELSVR